jgi:hypothetical protein
VAVHDAFGLATLRLYPRAAWEAFSRRAALALTPRRSSALCARPASPALCWEPLSAAQRHRSGMVLATTASAALTVLASIALGVTYLRERRRVHRDRIHVLRTLTHELRTPATTLRLDIEPLRAAYDDLPAACQEPLLRISDGIERLHRVLHRSARYLALFETPGAPRERLVKVRDVPSARALFEELADEWPEGVSLTAASADAPLRTDPEWLIAHALASTGTPEVRSPAAWASVSDPNPRVVWAPFRSPECTAFEQRAVGVQVRRVDEKALAWELWSKKPDELTEARLGSPAGVGRTALTPGDYRFFVVAGESRSFGPVEMVRGSRTVQPFHVAP